ncbi:clock-interacting pacemaker [Plakobranchus ocellatus]|uniref:Clock-interacting pacemaker n=1 Tax=Plakobranchus ocellatus TaxID=259542 RepID=A0AAV4B907_9GAST|nr:clock-interacting pacemaker [Plakobranchus ocellatus]
MSAHIESLESQKAELENFLLDSKDCTESFKNTDALCSGRSPGAPHETKASNQMNSQAASPFQSPASNLSCPSPQFFSTLTSGPKSAPPCSSYAVVSPLSHSYLVTSTPDQFKRISKSVSPRQFHSDSESSYRVGRRKHGNLRSQCSSPGLLLGRANRTKSATGSCLNRNFRQSNAIQEDSLPLTANVVMGTQNNNGGDDPPLNLFSFQPMDINHNPMTACNNILTNQNQAAQNHFLSDVSLTSNQDQHSNFSAASSPVLSSSESHAANTVDGNAIHVLSYADRAPDFLKQQMALSSTMDTHNTSLPIYHSPVLSQQSPEEQKPLSLGVPHSPATHPISVDDDDLKNEDSISGSSPNNPIIILNGPSAETSQTTHLPFVQSYANLTPWTTRFVTNNTTSIPNPTKETMPLSLGITDNLLFSTTTKRTQSPQVYSFIQQSYSSLQEPKKGFEEPPKTPHKDSSKELPNKQMRFRRTADALHKSGLWEVAMKTGSLFRRNKELQKELNKFRTDALIFLKSVIKNPYNWKLIKNVLSNALSSSQASSKTSPLMSVVVSSAAAAAVASAQFDSAGSSDGSSSVCGSVSDKSNNASSNSSGAHLVENHFAATKHGFSCERVPMDVN